MERILFIIFGLLLAIPVPAQQNRSVSLNYQHLRDAGNHGVGILHEFIHGYMSGKGTPPSLGDPPGTGAPYHVSIDDNTLVPLVNFGLSAEYDLSNNIFLTAGAKYMLDIDNSTYNDFPNLTAGIGYKF